MKGMTFTFPVDPATNSTPGATAPVTIKKQPLPPLSKAAQHAGGDLALEDALKAGGLTIDTQLGGAAGGENAPTPTGSTVPVNRTHYRGHHDSISSVSSDIYNTSQFTAPSPPTSNTSSGGGGINGVALTSSQGQSQQSGQQQSQQQQPGVIRFPNIFDDGFGPTALLCPTPTVKQNCTYGEAIGFAGLSSSTNHADVFSIQRPTFEFPLDELMNGDGSDAGSTTGYDSTSNLTNSVSSLSIPTPVSASMASFRELQITNVFGPGDAMQGVQATGLAMSKDLNGHHQPIVVDADLDGDELIRKSPPLIPSQSAPASPAVFPAANSNATNNNNNSTSAYPFPAASSPTDSFQIPPPLTLPKGANLPGPSPTPTPAPASSSSSGAPHRLPRRYSTTNAPPHTSSSASSDATTTGGSGKKGRHGPSATATAPRTIRSSYGNSAPGGVKSECANCGANSTPLWRRGLNDELNCNACGLFAKVRADSAHGRVTQPNLTECCFFAARSFTSARAPRASAIRMGKGVREIPDGRPRGMGMRLVSAPIPGEKERKTCADPARSCVLCMRHSVVLQLWNCRYSALAEGRRRQDSVQRVSKTENTHLAKLPGGP